MWQESCNLTDPEVTAVDNSTIALIVSIVALGGVLFLFIERQKTRTLKSHFGSEYDRAIEQEGSVRRAEAVLGQRQERVAKYQIRSLTREERDRYTSEWRSVQGRFVDDPRMAVSRADGLVLQAMGTRGYPVSDFDGQAADLSVGHPSMLGEYRAAHEIAVRSERGQATTEDLRLAMQYYRNLFEEIADTHAA
jgi:hypothetical protein